MQEDLYIVLLRYCNLSAFIIFILNIPEQITTPIKLNEDQKSITRTRGFGFSDGIRSVPGI